MLEIITRHKDPICIGTIGVFPEIEEPDKLPADGRVYDPAEFSELFAKIGNEFGGTLNQPRLPNLQSALIS